MHSLSTRNKCHNASYGIWQTSEIMPFPKSHCELNFLEQCCGHAKRVYRMNPPSKAEADLERNALEALDEITLHQMQRYDPSLYPMLPDSLMSHPKLCKDFMEAYSKGLDGKQAAWATKKYKGHRVLPDTLIQDLDTGGLS